MVKPILLTSMKPTQLEEVGLLVSSTEPPQGENSGFVSRAGEGILLCLRLRGEEYTIDCISV